MEASSKTTGESVTHLKEISAHSNRSKWNENVNNSENINPNLPCPGSNVSNSPSIVKSEKTAKKSASKNTNPNQVSCSSALLKKKIRERKFVVAKKKSSRNQESKSDSAAAVACDKCKVAIGKSKCPCLAYESLRASQDDFVKYFSETDQNNVDLGDVKDREDGADIAEGKIGRENENTDEVNSEMNLKRSRDKLLEAAMEDVPEPGSGRVLQLVKAFEKLSVLKLGDSEVQQLDVDNKEIKWAMPGLQQPSKGLETQVSSSSFCPSDFFLTSESLGLDSRRSYSLDSSQGSFSFSSRTSAGGQTRRRNSNESAGISASRQWRRKQRKTTSQKPFMLRTEQRGKFKEEEFLKKLQQMLEEEEKLRMPIAQGLPWTTDEPQCLPKPPVKENTRPVDLVLHSDVRAVDRSEFDQQVAEKMNLIERYRMERERLQKLAEEEEIRRLRKELVPKAQPMPYFDRPFIPSRSVKHPTIPKEPRFHIPQHKKIKCCASLDDFHARQQ